MIDRPMKTTLGLFVLIASLAGCSSVEPRYFVLNEMPSARANIPAHIDASRVIAVRKITVASYLDRPEIVKSADGPRLHIAPRDQWAEPLQDMVTRVFTEDLQQRMAPAQVFAENGAIGIAPDTTVEVNIARFGAENGLVLLRGQMAIIRHWPDGDRRQVQTIADQEPQNGSGSDALAAAMSRLLGRLADRFEPQPIGF